MPPPRFARKPVIGESSEAGSTSSMRCVPAISTRTLTFWPGTNSTSVAVMPSAPSYRARASAIDGTAIAT